MERVEGPREHVCVNQVFCEVAWRLEALPGEGYHQTAQPTADDTVTTLSSVFRTGIK